MSTTNKPTKQAASQAASQCPDALCSSVLSIDCPEGIPTHTRAYYKVRESSILRGMIVVYVYVDRERVAVYSLPDFLKLPKGDTK